MFGKKKPLHKSPIILEPVSQAGYFSYLYIFYIVAAIAYFVWRFHYTLQWNSFLGYLLIVMDMYIISSTIIFLITTRRLYNPIYMEPLTGVTTDVFIPTYNEPTEIVEMTALAAKNIEGISEVFVLDDGNRKEVKKMALSHGLRYYPRTTNLHAKAGNLNNGLLYSKADFIISLDCDHIPSKYFLKRTLGYFKDKKLGFVQTPQTFYNFKSIQHRENATYNLWNEQTMFYDCIQLSKNKYNAPFFCGSSAILRRKALDQIGGFATGTATEDIHTALKLHARGWGSLYINEKLAFGLAPEDLTEYHKQRVRWGAGSLGLLLRSKDSPLVAKGLSFKQRICYIYSTMAHSWGVQKFIYYFAPLISFLAVRKLGSSFIALYFSLYMGYISLSFFITYLYSRKTFQLLFTEQFDILNIFGQIEALKGVFRVEKKFGVSLKIKSSYENSYVFYALILLVAMLITANILFLLRWYVATGGNISTLFESTLAIGTFWNVFNIFFISSAILYLVNYKSRKKSPHRFEVDAPGKIDRSFPIDIKVMSFSGCDFYSLNTISRKFHDLSVSTSQGMLTIRGKLRKLGRRKGEYRLEFQPLSSIQKETLVDFMITEIQKHFYAAPTPAYTLSWRPVRKLAKRLLFVKL